MLNIIFNNIIMKFSIKKAIQKTFFCFTHCICIRKLLKQSCEEVFSLEPNIQQHPIFDLEKGEL